MRGEESCGGRALAAKDASAVSDPEHSGDDILFPMQDDADIVDSMV